MSNIKLGIDECLSYSKKILKFVDLIELRGVNLENCQRLLKYKKPLLLHFSYNPLTNKPIFIANENLNKFLISSKIKKMISCSSFPWISFHLGLPVSKFKVDENKNFIAASSPLTKLQFFKKVSQALQKIKKTYPQHKILLEIPPLLPHSISKGAYFYISDPDFVSEIVKKNDCYFLLDIAHLIVNANNLGYKNPKDFIKKLPLDKTIEVHIHHPIYDKKLGYFRDAHLPITDKEIKLLKWILGKAKNLKAIVLESQGQHQENVLIKELEILRSLT
ncbi:DUF692 family multinuclear iron-containing protein [Patescibacteria group bacterium]